MCGCVCACISLLPNTQAGFRGQSKTEDQLFRLAQNVIGGFKTAKALHQAYDRIWRKALLIDMMKMGTHGMILRWIQVSLIVPFKKN